MCVPRWAYLLCVITHPLSDCTLQPHTTDVALASPCLCDLAGVCVCVCACASPHLQLVTMEIGQAGGTRGKSRSMWFDWATHTAALVTHTYRHTYTRLTSDDDVYWWWRVPGSHSESRHESIKLPDPGLAGVWKPEPELVVQTEMKDIFYVRWGNTGPHTDKHVCVAHVAFWLRGIVPIRGPDFSEVHWKI